MKKCIKCGFTGEENLFAYKCNICKVCRSKQNRKNYLDRKEIIKEMRRKRYLDNKETVLEQTKKYRLKHLEHLKNKQKEYNSIKMKTDPMYRLRCNTNTLISHYTKGKGYTGDKKILEVLGCSFQEFVKHLQSKFKEGMTLENYGEWHIDHIVPISSAKTEEDLLKLNHYTNLQPLWAKENRQKYNKIITKEKKTTES